MLSAVTYHKKRLTFRSSGTLIKRRAPQLHVGHRNAARSGRATVTTTRCDKIRFVSTITLEVSVSTNLEVLEAEALKLAPVERSHLLERLIASLDSDPEVEEAWEREADRREAELESGSTLAVSGQEAISRLRARLQR